jgi:hypothetical protein
MTWREQWAEFEHGHKVALVLSAVAALVIVFLLWRLDAAQGAEARAALAESVARAKADTTRMLRDSLGFQRLVIQQTQKSDAVDRELDEMRRALVSLSIAVATREVRNAPASAPTTETAGGIRHSTFDVRTEPYTVHAEVSVPPPPAPGVMDLLRVSTDPFNMGARLGCTNKVNPLGMRDAMLTLTDLPAWVKPTITHVEQDPAVCPSPVLQRDVSGDDRTRWALVAGYGATYPSPAARGFVGLALSKPIPCPKFARGRVPGC